MNHLTTDEVAQLIRGELSEGRLEHAARCDTCADLTAAPLGVVTTTLTTPASPLMPTDVSVRLATVIADEANRRTSGEAEREAAAQEAAHAKRLSLGSFGDNSPHRNVLTKADAATERLHAHARH